ncbi:unnamed protein product [Ectocarpus sp. 12 AP-2014]
MTSLPHGFLDCCANFVVVLRLLQLWLRASRGSNARRIARGDQSTPPYACTRAPSLSCACGCLFLLCFYHVSRRDSPRSVLCFGVYVWVYSYASCFFSAAIY